MVWTMGYTLIHQSISSEVTNMLHATRIVESMPDLKRIGRFPSFARFVEKVTGRPL